VLGHDVVARRAASVRALLALTGQFAAVDELLTGRENLEMFGRLFRLARADARRPRFGATRAVRARRRSRQNREDILGRYAQGGSTSHRASSRSLACSSSTSRQRASIRGVEKRDLDIVRDLRRDGTTILLTDAVPRGSGSARGRDRRHRPWPCDRAGKPAASSKTAWAARSSRSS